MLSFSIYLSVHKLWFGIDFEGETNIVEAHEVYKIVKGSTCNSNAQLFNVQIVDEYDCSIMISLVNLFPFVYQILFGFFALELVSQIVNHNKRAMVTISCYF